MPAGTPIDTLIFHGSPNILIKHKALAVENEDIGCIETKKYESMSYDTSSIIPQQAGQLVAYIHQQIVAKVINCAVVGKVPQVTEYISCVLVEFAYYSRLYYLHSHC